MTNSRICLFWLRKRFTDMLHLVFSLVYPSFVPVTDFHQTNWRCMGGEFLALRLCVGPLLYVACIKEMKLLLLFRFLATPGIISNYHIILWFPWPGIIKIVFPEHQFYFGNKSQSTCLVYKVTPGSLREKKKKGFFPQISFALLLKSFSLIVWCLAITVKHKNFTSIKPIYGLLIQKKVIIYFRKIDE